MRHGSLFSGIGGFDLAADWMGWTNVFHCEKDPFCRKILNHYWPDTKSYEDIRQFSAVDYRGCVDIISGGFPCQPFSTAGRRKGKNDDRYLWPEALRVITAIKPRWIVLENVAGLFSILEPESLSEMEVQQVKLFCENEAQQADTTIIRLQRRVIGTIISEIGSAGYQLPTLTDGTPIVLCVPACAVNAPHRRDRIWFVAYADPDSNSQQERTINGEKDEMAKKQQLVRDFSGMPGGTNSVDGKGGIITDTDFRSGSEKTANSGRQVGEPFSQGSRFFIESSAAGFCGRLAGTETNIPTWDNWPAQPPVRGRNDGFPFELDSITFSKWSEESIKAYGNAIVPQVALEIFKIIDMVEKRMVRVFHH